MINFREWGFRFDRSRLDSLLLAMGTGGALVLSRFIEPSALPEVCLFKIITGIPCMFCGLTHAFHALSLGQVESALSFHPLVFPALALVVVLFLFNTARVIWPKNLPWLGDFQTAVFKYYFVGFTVFWLVDMAMD